MSTYAPDFLRIGVARQNAEAERDRVAVLSRRVANRAIVAVVSAPVGDAFSLREIATLDAALHGSGSLAPNIVHTALSARVRSASGESLRLTVLLIDDSAGTICVGEPEHALWLRRGPSLQRIRAGLTRCRPGDVIFVADGNPFPARGGESVPVLSSYTSADRLAHDFLVAALADTGSSGAVLSAAVAIRILSRDAMLLRRRGASAVAISVAIHLLLTGGLYLPSSREADQRERQRTQAIAIVTISSAPLRKRRTVPRPPAPQKHAMLHPRQVVQAPQPAPAVRHAPAPPPATQATPQRKVERMPLRRKSEMAAQRLTLEGSPSTSSSSQAPHFSKAALAALQQRLASDTSDLKPSDPLSVPSEAPGATKSYEMDMQGAPGSVVHGQGILRPIRQWTQDGYVYYYVTYEITYSDGTYESGTVPWPIRYLPADDPFTRPPHQIQLPAPLPDFVLPPGTQLGRALRPYFRDRYPTASIE